MLCEVILQSSACKSDTEDRTGLFVRSIKVLVLSARVTRAVSASDFDVCREVRPDVSGMALARRNLYSPHPEIMPSVAIRSYQEESKGLF